MYNFAFTNIFFMFFNIIKAKSGGGGGRGKKKGLSLPNIMYIPSPAEVHDLICLLKDKSFFFQYILEST